MKFEDIDNMSTTRLIIITKTSRVPAYARRAAIRLYELGEKNYAIDFLIKQMNRYKQSSTDKNIISETCPKAAIELGRLKDKRAIEPLFEALGELGFGPAFGLAQLKDPTIEERLNKLAEGESKVSIFAAVALGYMKNELVIPRLIHLLENHKEYEIKINDVQSWLKIEIVKILGAYIGNSLAEISFKKNVNKNDIDWFLSRYIHPDEHPSQRSLEWEIVTKYDWKAYLDTDENIFAFRHAHIDKWKEYSDRPCPFKTMEDADNHRQVVVNSIMKALLQQ